MTNICVPLYIHNQIRRSPIVLLDTIAAVGLCDNYDVFLDIIDVLDFIICRIANYFENTDWL